MCLEALVKEFFNFQIEIDESGIFTIPAPHAVFIQKQRQRAEIRCEEQRIQNHVNHKPIVFSKELLPDGFQLPVFNSL